MFAVHDIEEFEDEKEGVMRTGDVRRAMKYLAPLPYPSHFAISPLTAFLYIN
jgi:hypothetical protein